MTAKSWVLALKQSDIVKANALKAKEEIDARRERDVQQHLVHIEENTIRDSHTKDPTLAVIPRLPVRSGSRGKRRNRRYPMLLADNMDKETVEARARVHRLAHSRAVEHVRSEVIAPDELEMIRQLASSVVTASMFSPNSEKSRSMSGIYSPTPSLGASGGRPQGWGSVEELGGLDDHTNGDRETSGPHGQRTCRDDVRLTFENYQVLRDKLPNALARPLTAKLFLSLPRDEQGMLPLVTLLHALATMSQRTECYCSLSKHSLERPGYLSETELQTFLREFIAQTLSTMVEPSFVNTYLATLGGIILYYDMQPLGGVNVESFMETPRFFDLLEVREPTSSRRLMRNPLSDHMAHLIHEEFTRLLPDGATKVSKIDIVIKGVRVEPRTFSLIPPFLDRLFDEYVGGGPMSYAEFIRFYMSLYELVKSPSVRDRQKRGAPCPTSTSIGYLFRVVDLNKKGHLTYYDLNFFCRHIVENYNSEMEEPSDLITVDCVLNMLFDMVNPANASSITMQDIEASKMGHQFFSLLIDPGAMFAPDYVCNDDDEDDELEDMFDVQLVHQDQGNNDSSNLSLHSSSSSSGKDVGSNSGVGSDIYAGTAVSLGALPRAQAGRGGSSGSGPPSGKGPLQPMGRGRGKPPSNFDPKQQFFSVDDDEEDDDFDSF